MSPLNKYRNIAKLCSTALSKLKVFWILGVWLLELSSGLFSILLSTQLFPRASTPTYATGAAAGKLIWVHRLLKDRGTIISIATTLEWVPVMMLVTHCQSLSSVLHIFFLHLCLSLWVHPLSGCLLPFSASSELKPGCIRLWKTMLLSNFRHTSEILFFVLSSLIIESQHGL